eukprot:6050718-Ditylum_brightwellii.AAC.1
MPDVLPCADLSSSNNYISNNYTISSSGTGADEATIPSSLANDGDNNSKSSYETFSSDNEEHDISTVISIEMKEEQFVFTNIAHVKKNLASRVASARPGCSWTMSPL